MRAVQVARQLADDTEGNELAGWDEVSASAAGDDRTVSFGRPFDGSALRAERAYRITNPAAAAGILYGAPSGYAAAVSGQAVRPARPAQNQGGPRVPHIVN